MVRVQRQSLGHPWKSVLPLLVPLCFASDAAAVVFTVPVCCGAFHALGGIGRLCDGDGCEHGAMVVSVPCIRACS